LPPWRFSPRVPWPVSWRLSRSAYIATATSRTPRRTHRPQTRAANGVSVRISGVTRNASLYRQDYLLASQEVDVITR
jgi:hypothetical protein